MKPRLGQVRLTWANGTLARKPIAALDGSSLWLAKPVRHSKPSTIRRWRAMKIYDASSALPPISPVRFFENNELALADMKRMAELETKG